MTAPGNAPGIVREFRAPVNVDALGVAVLYRLFFEGEPATALSSVDAREFEGEKVRALWQAARQQQDAGRDPDLYEAAQAAGLSLAAANAQLDPSYGPACRSAADGVRRLAAETTRRREKRAAQEAAVRLADKLENGHGLEEARRVVAHLEAAEGAAGERLVPVDLSVWRASEPTPWLVEGLLAAGSVSMISAAAGTGKSLVALVAALRLASGDLGQLFEAFRAAEDPVPGAMFDAECGIQRMRLRTRELVEGNQLLPEVVDLALERLAIFTPEAMPNRAEVVGALPALIEQHGWRFVVLDPLRSFLPTNLESENDNASVGRFMDQLVAVATRTGTAILVLDHDSKAGGAARGASAKADAVATLWHLERPDADDEDYLQLTCLKSRDPSGVDRVVALQRVRRSERDGRHPLRFERTAVRKPGEGDGKVASALLAIRERLILRPHSQSELVDTLEFPRSTVRVALDSLVQSGVVCHTGESRNRSKVYRLRGTDA